MRSRRGHDVVTVALYYDTDASGLNGTAISGACASGAEGTNATCSCDTTGVTPGSYYVYGITDDGTNPAVSDYSPGQITILSPANLTQIHYRWRNDNGGESATFDAGTGADGSVTISASRNINTDILGSNRTAYADGISTAVTANPTGTSISVTSTSGFAADDEIILINLRGATGDTTDVGNYEFLEVAGEAAVGCAQTLAVGL